MESVRSVGPRPQPEGCGIDGQFYAPGISLGSWEP